VAYPQPVGFRQYPPALRLEAGVAELPEPGGDDRSCLFDEHPGGGAVDFDLRTKRGSPGAGRGWGNEHD